MKYDVFLLIEIAWVNVLEFKSFETPRKCLLGDASKLCKHINKEYTKLIFLQKRLREVVDLSKVSEILNTNAKSDSHILCASRIGPVVKGTHSN